MKNFLILDPSKYFLEATKKNKNFIYFKKYRFYKFKNKKFYDCTLKNYKYNSLPPDELKKLKQKIHLLGPTFTRWVGESHNYENLKSNFILNLAKFGENIDHLNIDIVIFDSGIPHHPEHS